MRIRFRLWHSGYMYDSGETPTMLSSFFDNHAWALVKNRAVLMMDSNILDMTGEAIYEGDILQFDNKAEWYRGELLAMMLKGETLEQRNTWLTEQLYERRVITLPDCYEWLMSSEIKQYWKVVGNIYENPDLNPERNSNERKN